MKSFFAYSIDELRTALVENQLPKFAAKQAFQWAYKKMQLEVEQWSDLSKKSRAFIKESISLDLPHVAVFKKSHDGTLKFLLKLQDGEFIESVVIYAKDRTTLCVSTQVGCAMECSFCHTATQGLKRNLNCAEIVGQYMAVTQYMLKHFKDETISEDWRISNIVYMGQGEPLHNYQNVKKATEIFMDTMGLGLGQRRITLSTSGLVPQIRKLQDFPPVNIAISLHATDDATRSSIMPINDLYGLKDLFEAIDAIPLKAYRRITYEYLLLKDVNDGKEDALSLVKLLKSRKSKVNLIPFNEFPGSQYKRPEIERIKQFEQILLQNGVCCTTRLTKGKDILAACGQLKSSEEKNRSARVKSNPARPQMASTPM